MAIRDCMTRNVVSIRATATVGEAAEVFVARHIGLWPVVDDRGWPIGIFGLGDRHSRRPT